MMFYKALRTGLLLILFVLSGGCLGQVHAGAFQTQEKNILKIYEGDQVKITVLGEDELTRIYTVNDAGIILFPMLGKIKIAGQSAAQIETKITSLLQDGYIIDPVVSVKHILKNSVYILGAVHEPGEYPLPKRAAHILQIVVQAGGYKNAAQNHIFEIIRETNNKKSLVESFSPYTTITDGDIIIVKEETAP